MWLEGTEALTIELSGVLPEAATNVLAAKIPDRFVLERDGARCGRVSIVVIDMRGLGPDLPAPARFASADYRELLYRIGASYDGAPAWLALRCDIDRAFVRALAARLIRYPVAAGVISIVDEEATIVVDASVAGDRFAVTVDVDGLRTPPVEPPRRTFVMDDRALYEIPWQERPTPRRFRARVDAVDLAACVAVFGADVRIDAAATVHRGRIHRCGRARAV